MWRSTERTDGQSSKQQRHFHPSGLRTLTLSSFFSSGWRQCKNSGRGQYLCLHTTIPTTTTYLLRAKMRFKSKAFYHGNVSEILNLSAVTHWFMLLFFKIEIRTRLFLSALAHHCAIQTKSWYSTHHSMARANLNKSKKVLTSPTTASKYIPKRPRICIN